MARLPIAKHPRRGAQRQQVERALDGRDHAGGDLRKVLMYCTLKTVLLRPVPAQNSRFPAGQLNLNDRRQ